MPSNYPDIAEFFKDLNIGTIGLVDAFYDEQAVFEDPLGRHVGREAIRRYYTNLYQHVKSIEFKETQEIAQANKRAYVWTMHLVSGLKGGKLLTVKGISWIEVGGPENKVIYHRDYFDMGEFVYETIPLLGGIIRFIKRKLRGH